MSSAATFGLSPELSPPLSPDFDRDLDFDLDLDLDLDLDFVDPAAGEPERDLPEPDFERDRERDRLTDRDFTEDRFELREPDLDLPAAEPEPADLDRAPGEPERDLAEPDLERAPGEPDLDLGDLGDPDRDRD